MPSCLVTRGSISFIQVHMPLCDFVMNIPKHSLWYTGLEYLSNSSVEEVRKNAEGALWILKAVKSSGESVCVSNLCSV